MAELAAQGLDLTVDEVTLGTRFDGPGPVWTAATRDRSWETRFA